MGKHLQRAFADDYEILTHHRRADAEFDQICADFEDLSAVAADRQRSDDDDEFRADVSESLEMLKAEIAGWLAKTRYQP